jgi:hypothetical protein
VEDILPTDSLLERSSSLIWQCLPVCWDSSRRKYRMINQSINKSHPFSKAILYRDLTEASTKTRLHDNGSCFHYDLGPNVVWSPQSQQHQLLLLLDDYRPIHSNVFFLATRPDGIQTLRSNRLGRMRDANESRWEWSAESQ